MVFMNLILINTFLCIIRNNYAEIKEKKQKFNEAYNLFLRDRSEEVRGKFINLFLCRDPQIVYKENLEENNPIDILFNNNVLDKSDIEDKIRIKTKINNESSGSSMWSNFTTNFKNLDLKRVFFGDEDEQSKFELVKFKKYKEIDKANFLNYLNEIEIDYEKEYSDLTDTICYVFFIFIFVFMVYIQLSLSKRSELEQYVSNLWSQKFPNNQNNNWKTVKEDIDNLIKNTYLLSSDFVTNEQCETYVSSKSQGSLLEQKLDNYLYLQAPHYRLTYRFFNYIDNPDTKENEFFKSSLNENSQLLDFCQSSSELRKDFNEDVFEKEKKVFSFTRTDLSVTSSECGGYIYYLRRRLSQFI
jgi:hypothetical protein